MDGEHWDEYIKYLVGECGLRHSTAFTYQCNHKRIEKFCGKSIEEITPADVRRFMRESHYHPATKSATLVAVKSFHKFGNLEGWWPLNGIMSLRAPKQPHNVRPALSVPEARTLLSACSTALEHRLVWLGLYAGLRVSDSARLTQAEWIHEPETLKIRMICRKSGRLHEVPIHPELAAQREAIFARYTTRDSLKSTARSLSFCTRIPFTSHTLRRTFAAQLLEAGIQEGVVEALLDHAPTTVLRSSYVGVSWHEKVDAVAKLRY